MLSIKNVGNGKWTNWHVGKSLPDLYKFGRVVTIQADGHELTWLVRAIKCGADTATKEYYETVWGVDTDKETR